MKWKSLKTFGEQYRERKALLLVKVNGECQKLGQPVDWRKRGSVRGKEKRWWWEGLHAHYTACAKPSLSRQEDADLNVKHRTHTLQSDAHYIHRHALSPTHTHKAARGSHTLTYWNRQYVTQHTHTHTLGHITAGRLEGCPRGEKNHN